MPSVNLDARRCGDLGDSRATEWMVANGRGGFAMASVNQMLTRRYHGLLVAAIQPPVDRFVLLAKLDVTATVKGLTYDLATNDYSEAVHPQGYKLLESFRPRPYPTWRWRLGGTVVEQTLCMVEGRDTTYTRYRLVEGDGPVGLSVRPLCTSRHFHHLTHYQDMGPPTVAAERDSVSIDWAGHRPGLHLSHNGAFKSRPDWYYQFVLSAEAQRGYDATQDLFMPGVIGGELGAGDPVGLVIAASTAPQSWKPWRSAFEKSQSRYAVEESFKPGDALQSALTQAATDFLVARGEKLKTVIAGYPWFGDWGRDTFISLPGLCLATGRHAEARSCIEAFAPYVDRGMIPNRFPDYGQPAEYNTSDASLWYIHAIDRYLAYTDDWAFIADRMFPFIAQILDAHEHGTRYGIAAQSDGLLAAGETGYALTWMDALVYGRAVTPRIGKAVEVNALWYNALRIAADYAARRGELSRADHWRVIAGRCATAFNNRFWNPVTGCLFDVVDQDGRAGMADGSIRPNQLWAVSLTHPVLDKQRWRDVVEVCHRELWTPMGLHSLSRSAPAYRGQYKGDVTQRDAAYHQGTVWPWLLGPFVTAFLRAHGQTPQNRSIARKFLEGLEPHLTRAGLGGVSEVADGDQPHDPGGCPWQAWSVAEPLRALCEDILQTHPQRRDKAPTGDKRVGSLIA